MGTFVKAVLYPALIQLHRLLFVGPVMTIVIERGGLREPSFRFSDWLLLFLRQALKHSALRIDQPEFLYRGE